MEAAFLKNKIDMVVDFNEPFADGLYCGDARVQLIVDATDPNMSTSQINYATGIVSAVGQEMISPVSYTHLDVYKRQVHYCLLAGLPDEGVQVTGGEA